ncbi:hypothetical protein BD410DRAFT_842907 [Rickenella mellea]|uniref:Uncharacterized protein n=1 Tax=Rickenella mellea TaxID=50990 RepID=A0A4Y7PS86_9AGAM|nr:hypothetical protein BD410DRAFT_842907 [Rickenella mellea]
MDSKPSDGCGGPVGGDNGAQMLGDAAASTSYSICVLRVNATTRQRRKMELYGVFALGPSTIASGHPRRESSWHKEGLTNRTKEEGEGSPTSDSFLRIRGAARNHEAMFELGQDNNIATSDAENSVSTDRLANTTALGLGTPSGSVVSS